MFSFLMQEHGEQIITNFLLCLNPYEYAKNYGEQILKILLLCPNLENSWGTNLKNQRLCLNLSVGGSRVPAQRAKPLRRGSRVLRKPVG